MVTDVEIGAARWPCGPPKSRVYSPSMTLTGLSKEVLLAELMTIASRRCVLEAQLLARLIEVERRAIYLEEAYSSLHDFCVRHVRMSEDEASRRVTAARMAKEHPMVLDMIERGDLHLTTLLLLRGHLTAENRAELLA